MSVWDWMGWDGGMVWCGVVTGRREERGGRERSEGEGERREKERMVRGGGGSDDKKRTRMWTHSGETMSHTVAVPAWESKPPPPSNSQVRPKIL